MGLRGRGLGVLRVLGRYTTSIFGAPLTSILCIDSGPTD